MTFFVESPDILVELGAASTDDAALADLLHRAHDVIAQQRLALDAHNTASTGEIDRLRRINSELVRTHNRTIVHSVRGDLDRVGKQVMETIEASVYRSVCLALKQEDSSSESHGSLARGLNGT